VQQPYYDFCNITIDHNKFKNISNSITNSKNTNKKWFKNLSNKDTPTEVISLLQLGEGFSVPMYKNKKCTVIEFIKDIEGRELGKNNNQKLKIRNTVVTQLERFMDRK